MKPSESSAKKIALQALDGTNTAIQAGDFSAFADFFSLPHAMEIDGNQEIISTRQALETVFNRFQKHLEINNVTMIHRICLSAEFVQPDLVHTTHETRLVSGTRVINEPYPVYSQLKLTDGRWQIVSSQTAFPDTSHLGKSLLDDLG